MIINLPNWLRSLKQNLFAERNSMDEVMEYTEECFQDPQYRTAAFTVLGVASNTLLELLAQRMHNDLAQLRLEVYKDDRLVPRNPDNETRFYYEVLKDDETSYFAADYPFCLSIPLTELLENPHVSSDD